MDLMIELGRIISFEKGKKPIELATERQEGYLPYVDIEAFETGTVKKYTSGEKCLACEDGDILIVCDGSRSGLVGYAIHGFVGSTLAKISCEVLLNQYLFYFLQGKYKLLNTSKKGTGTPHLNPTLLKQQKIVVPSIEEQQRIVTRIEELFSELDSAVETLQKTKQQLEVYRQAVLKEAFEGKLTQKWRTNCTDISINDFWNNLSVKKNTRTYKMEVSMDLPELPDNWKWVNIGDITNGTEYGTSKKSLKEGKVPVIRMGNLQNGTIDWSDLVYSSDDNEIKKYILLKNDVLFNRTNSPELVGKTSVYLSERVAIFAGYLIRINQFDFINAKYLTYFLNSFIAKNYGNKVKTDGVNQSNINGKKLCSYPFPLCTPEEQRQVVCELETRLSVCSNIERTVNESLQQAEALRQSILKQAFEGEIVNNA